MARVQYENWKPSEHSLSLVRIANDICAEMKEQGYDLTLRQLYYQFVARAYIPNNQRSYDNLGSVINRARLAGLLDWDYIEDRTRNLQKYAEHRSPASIINEYAYGVSRWTGQQFRVEVWVEKEALVGVVQRAAQERRMDFFACRGYVSQSELHSAAMRHNARMDGFGQQTIVVHLGDHDPSGIDMTRDIEARLRLFGASTEVKRIALNYDQVEQYGPPPNPAKLSDSRAAGYVETFGRLSWELDALEPRVLHQLILDTADEYIDLDLFQLREQQEDEGRELLRRARAHWPEVEQLLRELQEDEDGD
jgi:hypothetical protein